jgi:hypothetical protein
MKRAQRQIEILQRSARRPARVPAPPLRRSAREDAAESDRPVVHRAPALAPARRPGSVPASAAATLVTDWQPIATTPGERNVKVTVRDRIDHIA